MDMVEWFEAKDIKNDLKRLSDSEKLKKLENKIKNMESVRDEIKFKKETALFVKENIIEAYRRSVRLPSVGEYIYLDKYINEEKNGDFMMGKVKDTYFITYLKGDVVQMALFKRRSTQMNNFQMIHSFDATTIDLGWFCTPIAKTVKKYEISSQNDVIDNEKYIELSKIANRIDDRQKRYSDILFKR